MWRSTKVISQVSITVIVCWQLNFDVNVRMSLHYNKEEECSIDYDNQLIK